MPEIHSYYIYSLQIHTFERLLDLLHFLEELGIKKHRPFRENKLNILLSQYSFFIRLRPTPNRNALCVRLLPGAVTSPSTNEEKFKYAFSNNCPLGDGIMDGAVAASDGGGDSCSCLAMWARQVDSGVANSCAPTLYSHRDDQWSASLHTLSPSCCFLAMFYASKYD